jgi:sucrose-phosphate synthase
MSSDGVYIQMFSVHGLVRSRNIEMGRDADTGGQVKYVIELARSLGRQKGVAQVDLFTRLIKDKRVAAGYARAVERISRNTRIVRVKCGGVKYHRKELLWPYLEEYVDRVLTFTKKEGRIPDAVHGHYADGGYVAMSLSPLFGVPALFTGHSLGRNKKQKLLAGGMSEEEIEAQYHIDRRIAVEESVIDKASLVVTSTSQEISKQYGLYDNQGRTEYEVIPPGVDLDLFYPYYEDRLRRGDDRDEKAIQTQSALLEELNRFFTNPEKPLVLSLCRPDKRKNISGLIEAFGEDRDLQAMANLAIFAGIRKDISQMGENEKEVLTDMLLFMDKYDLYGNMAMPKTHSPTDDVPALYRIAAASRGVFVNSALTEPFGLTALEAAGCGLPIVATNDGGPVDIVANCSNGILVDVTKTEEIARACRAIVSDREKWKAFSSDGINGVRKHYTWEAHCERYVDALARVMETAGGRSGRAGGGEESVGERLSKFDKLIITDIDNTLTGDDDAMRELFALLEEHKETVGFCVATGRTVDSTQDLIAELRIPHPDIIISSVGSEIHYARSLIEDKGWASHISQGWDREAIADLLSQLDFIELQEHENQRTYKISFYMKPSPDHIPWIYECMENARLRINVIYSHQSYLDVLPYRASKGKAVKYLSGKWHFPPEKIMVFGDSGNDEEMLRGQYRGVVVGNYSSEMEKLKGRKEVYFSPENNAAGILDGIRKYGFLEPERDAPPPSEKKKEDLPEQLGF